MARLRAIAAALLMAASGAPVAASSVSGTVRDDGGAALAGVTFHVRDVSTGHRTTFDSDESGRFVWSDAAPGLYDVRAEKRGFRPVHEAVKVDARRDLRLELTLLPFPPRAELAFDRGVAALNADDADTAAEALEQALRLAPQDADVRLNLGLVYLRLSRPDDARREFEAAAALGRSRRHGQLDLALALGAAYAAMGDAKRASAWYERALRMQEAWPAALFGLAKCYLVTQPAKAIELFRRLIALAPRSPEAAQAQLTLGR